MGKIRLLSFRGPHDLGVTVSKFLLVICFQSSCAFLEFSWVKRSRGCLGSSRQVSCITHVWLAPPLSGARGGAHTAFPHLALLAL